MSSYGSLCTEFYDLDKPGPPPSALSFYAEKARGARGRVLEPMCGSGRFLIPLIRAEVPVDGADSSPNMLAACRRRLASERLHADLYEQPLERLNLPHRYNLAFVPSGSIGLLTTDEALHAAISRLRTHLEPGATLLLEFTDFRDHADAFGPRSSEPRTVSCPDGSVIAYTSSAHRMNDRRATLVRGRYEKTVNHRLICSEDEVLVVRSYAAEWLCSLLRVCGFENTHCSTSQDLPFLHESGCALIEAR